MDVDMSLSRHSDFRLSDTPYELQEDILPTEYCPRPECMSLLDSHQICLLCGYGRDALFEPPQLLLREQDAGRTVRTTLQNPFGSESQLDASSFWAQSPEIGGSELPDDRPDSDVLRYTRVGPNPPVRHREAHPLVPPYRRIARRALLQAVIYTDIQAGQDARPEENVVPLHMPVLPVVNLPPRRVSRRSSYTPQKRKIVAWKRGKVCRECKVRKKEV